MSNVNLNNLDIINLTPHSISFVGDDGSTIITIEPCGSLARVSASTEKTGAVINGIPVTRTVYVVSSIVAARCPDRDDVFIPNESVRDSEGRIVGCKSLGHV